MENNIIASVDISSKYIGLKQANNGTQVTIEIPIALRGSQIFNLNHFNQDNKVILKGTYVSGQGVQTAIDKEIIINASWTGTSEIEASGEVVKYVPYDDGVMVQFLVKTALKNRNAPENRGVIQSLPIQKTTITAKAPMFNGFEPIGDAIKVAAGSTYITNGKDADNLDFTNENWNYNATTKEVTISVENKPSGANKVWGSFGGYQFDEYYITYLYPKAAKDSIGASSVTVTNTVNAKIEYYKNATGTNSGVSSKDINTPFTLQEPIGNMVVFEIDSPNLNIQKGFMYNNFESDVKNATEYKVDWIASIAYSNAINGILMTQNENLDIYKSGTGNVNAINGQNTICYKETSIVKNTFDRILGEDGYIRILDANNGDAEIGRIDKDTVPTQDGYLIADYSSKNETIYNIKVETSAPIMEGELKLTHSKIIRTNLGDVYDLNKVKQFEYLNSYVKGAAKFGTGSVGFTDVNFAENNIEFITPYTKATLQMTPDRYSVTNINKNVKLEIVLRKDAAYFDLYKNPIVQIELPSYIENIDIKSINILYADGLTLGSVTQNGNILTIPLAGNQTVYSPVQAGGTIIELTVDLKVKLTTPNSTSEAKLYVYNEKANRYDNPVNYNLAGHNPVGLYNAPISFVAPTGMITYNNIKNYDTTGNVVTSLDNENNVGLISHLAASKVATMTLGLVNNYSNNCSDIRLLGRIPFSHNKFTQSGTDLGSTFNTVLKSVISQTGVDSGNMVVYYSTNGEATEDLTNPVNAWTTDTANLDNVKSYLIVLENYIMPQGKEISFSYDFEIPANMSLNEEAYGTFIAYFNYDAGGTKMPDYATPAKVGIATKQGAKLEVVKTANVQNNAEVTEYQIIKYTVKVKNIGELPAENFMISDKVPVGTTYGTYEETGMNYTEFVTNDAVAEIKTSPTTLTPDQSKEISFFVKVNPLSSGVTSGQIENVAKITATDIEQESNKITNTVVKADLLIEKSGLVQDGSNFLEGSPIIYNISVKNVTGDTVNNVVIEDYLPAGITYNDGYIIETTGRERTNVTYDESTRLLAFNIGTLAPDEEKWVEFVVDVDYITDGTLKRTIVNKATVSSDSTPTRTSNELTYYVDAPKIEITKTSNVPTREVSGLQEIEYTITVKNTGEGSAVNAIISDKIPDGMILRNCEPEATGRLEGSGDIFWSVSNIAAGQSLEFKITVIVPTLPENVESQLFINKANLQATNVKKITSNEVIHELLEASDSNLKITGTAWLDENKDGERQASEKLLEGIPVILVDASNGNVVRDKDTDVEKTITTGEDGTYLFENLEDDKEYIVAFIFDSKAYGITTYRKPGVPSEASSDAIGRIININGVSRDGAITDKLKMEGSSIYNINIGLVENPNFDLSLTKYVKQVVVQNQEGIKTIDFNNTQLAKVDIKDKYMPGSVVTIAYRIVVANKGDVPGYAKKVVDDLPSDIEFSVDNNPGWTKAIDGRLYYTGLEDIEINPGESEEIYLIVTKTLTDSSTINIVNTAEIYEDYNILGAEDINSTPNNGVQTENDYSRAETLVTIKTGQATVYFVLGFAIVSMLGMGVYFIKRKVL